MTSLKRSEELILQLLDELEIMKVKDRLRISRFDHGRSYKDTYYQGGQFYSISDEAKQNSITTEDMRSNEEGKYPEESDYENFFEKNKDAALSCRPNDLIIDQIRQEKQRRQTKLYSYEISQDIFQQTANFDDLKDESL